MEGIPCSPFTEIGSCNAGNIFQNAYGFSDINIHRGVRQKEMEGRSSVTLTA